VKNPVAETAGRQSRENIIPSLEGLQLVEEGIKGRVKERIVKHPLPTLPPQGGGKNEATLRQDRRELKFIKDIYGKKPETGFTTGQGR